MVAVPAERIEHRIQVIRGHKAMLDADLAELYGVLTKVLNQAVKRNRNRFPPDFMFRPTRQEAQILKSQIVISSWWGGRRYLPLAFTEQGVAMLSSVLRSEPAVQVHIAIMRAFVKLREMLTSHSDLARKLDEMERKYDGQFRIVFDAIRELMAPPVRSSRRIGFTAAEAKRK